MQLAGRAAASAVLGVLATPLGAVLPTIQFGLGAADTCTQSASAPAPDKTPDQTTARSAQQPVFNR
jgi:hypothetical protein